MQTSLVQELQAQNEAKRKMLTETNKENLQLSYQIEEIEEEIQSLKT